MESLPRILFFGERHQGRRLRMTGKVLAELRRRSFPFSAIAYGELSDELTRATLPDELHPSLSVQELLNLFLSVSLILETANEPENLSLAYRVGKSAGIAILCHREAGSSDFCVDEWSADAFADAILAMSFDRLPHAEPARVRKAIQEVLYEGS